MGMEGMVPLVCKRTQVLALLEATGEEWADSTGELIEKNMKKKCSKSDFRSLKWNECLKCSALESIRIGAVTLTEFSESGGEIKVFGDYVLRQEKV